MTTETRDAAARAARFREDLERVRAEVGRAIVGQDAVIDSMLIALLAGGHVLLEGVPGLAKTLMVRSLADTLDLSFARIQFTPDLMPADVTGTNILDEGAQGRSFRFERGPIFGNLVLADEINRATPKTQSALLEAMQEGAVTVSGSRHELDPPFTVLATQNPIEMEGTYPLPEAQLDRFLLKVAVHAPPVDDLVEVLQRTTGRAPAPLERVLSRTELLAHRELVRDVPIATPIVRYVATIVHACHPAEATGSKARAGQAIEFVERYVRFGPSPRGGQSIVLAAKAHALMRGRHHVAHEDVRAVVHAALRHRLILNFDAEADRVDADAILDAVLEAVPEDPPEVRELLDG